MSYIDFAFGAMASLLVCVGSVSYDRFRKRPNRLVPPEARRRRTLEQEALARAFAALYARHADETFPHFVLPEDREFVSSIVKDFFRENRDKLGEMHVGSEFFEVGEDELAENTVNRAIELFLRI